MWPLTSARTPCSLDSGSGLPLSADNKRSLWIPPGFGHGFLVLTDFAEVAYKATALYAPAFERSILWNDPAIGIEWPLDGDPTLSDKDKAWFAACGRGDLSRFQLPLNCCQWRRLGGPERKRWIEKSYL